MRIGKRFDEEHTHNSADGICVTSHKRTINGKTFLFTRVSTRRGTLHVGAYRQDIVINRIHGFSGNNKLERV